MVLAVPTPITFSVGAVLTAGQMNTNVRDGVLFAINPPIFQATVSATQSIPNNPTPFTDVLWDTNVVDTYGGHSVSTNTARYVAQVAGYYRVNGKIGFGSNITGLRQIAIGKNGTGFVNTVCIVAPISGTTTLTTDTILQLAVSDYVTVQAFQNSGGALSLAPTVSKFEVHWLHA